MIYLPFIEEPFEDFDDLLHWFCDEYPDDLAIISSEVQDFLEHCFPLIDLNALCLTIHISYHEDIGSFYSEFHIDYNKEELIRCYPEYFI